MKSRKENSISIKKYKNRREMNLGIFLFVVVLIYLIVTVIMYVTDDKISPYEVRKGSIVKDNTYTGLIIREEMAVNADSSGYISYYQNENSKVKTGTYIYAVSPQKLDVESAGAENSSVQNVNSEIRTGITLQIQKFNENYKPNDFAAVYSLKNEINTSLQKASSATRREQLRTLIAESGQDILSFAAPRDGIVTFSVDGYETLTKDTFTEENFDRTKYESKRLSDQMKISAGEPAYRLITSENWSVVIQLDRETAEQFKNDEVSSVKVRIDKDSETLWADFSLIERSGEFYGCLEFDNSMIRYANERYLNVELILEDETGLKIPKSSVVEEKFYVIPEEYLTTGGDSSSQGVMVQGKNGGAEFKPADMYDLSEDGEACISSKDLHEGDILLKPESSETYTVGKTKALTGVYNINKGYAVFNKVSILCENDEYYIVEEGEDYGLSNYDHIVQNGSQISPEEVVFQ